MIIKVLKTAFLFQWSLQKENKIRKDEVVIMAPILQTCVKAICFKILSILLTTTLWGRHYSSHISDKYLRTMTQRTSVPWPWSHTLRGKAGIKLKSLWLKIPFSLNYFALLLSQGNKMFCNFVKNLLSFGTILHWDLPTHSS